MKIGIVTISFNQARFLAEAIQSVRVNPPHELCYVMVDPGSTDGSREVIERYRDRFHKIMLDKDKGPANGLNKGFAVCDADVYGWLNSDDRFVPGALDFVADYFEKANNVDVLCGAIRIIDEHGTARRRARTADMVSPRRYAIRTCQVCQQATFFRQRILKATGGLEVRNGTCWDGE